MSAAPAAFAWGRVGPPWWDERPVFIIGGGPSLAGRDIAALAGRGWILGVNRAADLVPCDATFSLDNRFITERRASLEDWARTQQVYLAMELGYGRTPIPGAIYLVRHRGAGLSRDPGAVRNGLNSGYSALNLAVLKRAREIYLLGFDMRQAPADGPTHWHGGYPWHQRGKHVHLANWVEKFTAAARQLPPGCRVINANPASAIRVFPFTTYAALGI